MKHICEDAHIGSGTYKIAYSTKICDDAKSHYFTSDVDPKELCIVKFKDAILLMNFTAPSPPVEQFYNFKMKLQTDTNFKYTMREMLFNKTLHLGKRDTPFIPPLEYSDFFKDKCPLMKIYGDLSDFFYNANEQFEMINELKQMHKLSSIGFIGNNSGGGGGGGGAAPTTHSSSFAPKLYQIRLDIVIIEQINNGSENILKEKIITHGTPFTPDKMDEEFAKIPNNSFVKVSYLIERCGESIKTYVNKFPYTINAVGKKVSDFIDSYVDATNELNCDFKPENLCPKYEKSNIKTVLNEIESIQMLDVDTQFLISGEGKSPDFSKHAKVFMKFLFFSYFPKYTTIQFNDWHISKLEASDMIMYFLKREFMIYEYNPINMLYYYLIKKNANEEYHYYDSLIKNNVDVISLFRHPIRTIPQNDASLHIKKSLTMPSKTLSTNTKRFKLSNNSIQSEDLNLQQIKPFPTIETNATSEKINTPVLETIPIMPPAPPNYYSPVYSYSEEKKSDNEFKGGRRKTHKNKKNKRKTRRHKKN